MDFSRGRLVPITDAGLLPVGSLVSYGDMANPRKTYLVTGATVEQYLTGQRCICEDGHTATVSRHHITGPGGWHLETDSTNTPRILDEAERRAFCAAADERKRLADLESARAAAEKQRNDAADRERWAREFPYLATTASKKDGPVLGAANLRVELKRAFPGIKFSVTSKSYSGGCSISVGWILGPTTAEVEAIADKYSQGSFDGMTDCYDYSHAQWPDIYGGAKYVSCSRSEGDMMPVVASLCALHGVPTPERGNYWSTELPGGRVRDDVGSIARRIILTQPYPAGARITGAVRVDNPDARDFSDYYRATWEVA